MLVSRVVVWPKLSHCRITQVPSTSSWCFAPQLPVGTLAPLRVLVVPQRSPGAPRFSVIYHGVLPAVITATEVVEHDAGRVRDAIEATGYAQATAAIVLGAAGMLHFESELIVVAPSCACSQSTSAITATKLSMPRGVTELHTYNLTCFGSALPSLRHCNWCWQTIFVFSRRNCSWCSVMK
jgi:hypothetical protein